LENTCWALSRNLRLTDWREGDAIVYLGDSGDLHVINELTRKILGIFQSGPLTLDELSERVSFLTTHGEDPHYLGRHIVQLESLGVLYALSAERESITPLKIKR